MRIFYDTNSVSCQAATYLLTNYFENIDNDKIKTTRPMEHLKEVEELCDINITDIIMVIGWHDLDKEAFSRFLSLSNNIYWYAADTKSNEFIKQYPEFEPIRDVTKLHGIVTDNELASTAMLIYMQFYTTLSDSPNFKIARALRKVRDIAPAWISYLNGRELSERATKFRYALKYEMKGISDPRWDLLNKKGVSGTAELLKWIDRGETLMAAHKKAEEQQALLQTQRERKSYKAPESWASNI